MKNLFPPLAEKKMIWNFQLFFPFSKRFIYSSMKQASTTNIEQINLFSFCFFASDNTIFQRHIYIYDLLVSQDITKRMRLINRWIICFFALVCVCAYLYIYYLISEENSSFIHSCYHSIIHLDWYNLLWIEYFKEFLTFPSFHPSPLHSFILFLLLLHHSFIHSLLSPPHPFIRSFSFSSSSLLLFILLHHLLIHSHPPLPSLTLPFIHLFSSNFK